MTHPAEILDRVPPHDVDAERAVLGAILLDHDKIEGIGLEPRDFHAEQHRILFELLQQYPHAGNVDAALLRRWATDAGQWERIGGAAYVGELIQAATVAHVADHAAAIREAAQRRRAIQTALDVVRAAYTSNGEWPAELAAGVESLGRLADGDGGADELPAYTGADLAGWTSRPRFFINRVLVQSQPLIVAGEEKSLKTSILLDAGISLASGSDFLGTFTVPHPVRFALLSGESGIDVLAETAQRIARAKGIDLAAIEGFILSDRLPTVDKPGGAAEIKRFCKRHRPDVLAIDPAYMALSADDPANMFAVGECLRGITSLCRDLGTSLILAHHCKKRPATMPYRVPTLQDIAWAGFAPWCRQWWLLGRREAYDATTGTSHLDLAVGGSAGHGGLWSLTVTEGMLGGDCPRVWDVEVMRSAEAREREHEQRQEAAEQKAKERQAADIEKLCRAMAKHPNGESKSFLRDLSGLPTARANAALAALLEAGDAEPCEVFKSGKKTPIDGFRLTSQD